MYIRKLLVVLSLIGVFAMFAVAADVSGKWKAESTGPDGQVRTTNFTFKAEGEKLTGSVSGRQGDTAISEGKISGDEISFVVVRGERKMQYKGKVSGDEIKLSVQFGPDMPPREMVAKRVKE